MSIQLTDLTKRFGRTLVVNRVTLEIQDGELFVLLGGSGSGKSTILRLIAGLIQPDSGKIELHGEDVTYLPPQARGTGFVFQNYSVFRHMTVAQNVDFGLKIRGTNAHERRNRVEELLDLVGLGGLGARFADQLSGGQQQRVALARALAYRPAVLLLDEPFSALDVKIRGQLRQSVRDIQDRLDVTTILVTHDQEEAFELADRVGIIDSGRVIEIGTPQELYHQPRSEFAATFIGSGNVLAGRRDKNQINLGQVQLPLPDEMPEYEDGAPVRILFRPETVRLYHAGAASGGSPKGGGYTLGDGTITNRVFSGALQRLTVAVERLQGARPLMPRLAYGQSQVLIEVVRPSEAGETPAFALGQRVMVELPDFHVLQPSGLKVLICTEPSPGGAAGAEFGFMLADAAGGPVTQLAVARRPEEIPVLRSQLDNLRAAWLDRVPFIQNTIRQGDAAAEMLAELAESDHELIILGRNKSGRDAHLGKTSREVFLNAQVPILLTGAPHLNIQRMLICTAAGEPGKADIRFGGRLARRTGAEVTVLHVGNPAASSAEQERAGRHMQQAHQLLSALGVRSNEQVRRGEALDEILAEIRSGVYDLVVLGAPAPRVPQRLVWSDLTIQVITQTTLPILIVPMMK
jgi:sulfate transport system ATP-binding protein